MIHLGELFLEFFYQFGRKIEYDPALAHKAAAEAAASECKEGVDYQCPGHAEDGVAHKIRHVIGDGPQIADMYRGALHFKRDGADRLGPAAYLDARQGFHRVRIGGGMADHRIARDRFREMYAGAAVMFHHQLFDAAVLVAELYLEMVYVLALAHEPEMAGFDDARVDGPHRHLVHLLALHGEEGIVLHRALAVGAVVAEAHSLEPGMAFREDAGILDTARARRYGSAALPA